MYEKLVLLLIPTLWKVWGYGKLVLLLIPTLWKVCGYGKLVLLLIPTLWNVCGYQKDCFVANTHAMESLWVSEACLVADAQIVKTGRYNKGIIYSRMHAASIRGVYGSPTLRAMHSIHKCVAKDAPHLFHWRLSPYKVKNKNSDLWASSQIAVFVLTLHGS